MEGARLASVSASMAIAAGWFFTRQPFSGGVSFMFGITTTIDSSGSAYVENSRPEASADSPSSTAC